MTLRADIATGETTLDRIDLRLEGALPLVLARRYRSGAPSGIFGVGWEHGLDRTLRVEADRVVHRDGAGRETAFAPIPIGMEARHPEGLTLQRHAEGYIVFASPCAQEVFRSGRGGVLQLERIVDTNGNRIKLRYSGERVAEVSASGGQRVRFAYAGEVVTQIALVGTDGRAVPVRTFRYGTGGTLVSETDGEGRTTEYAYNRGLLVRVGAGSAAWLAQYDGDGRCLALWRADGTAATHLHYDMLRQTTRAVGLDGRQVVYRHAMGTAGSVVIEREDAASESLHYYYDEAQRLIGYDEADGTVVTFQRLDVEKSELVQIDGERRFLTTTLNEAGLVGSVEAGDEGFTFAYDKRFNPTGITTPLGAAWTFERDAKGRVVTIASPAGRRVALRRDGATLTVEGSSGPHLWLTSDVQGRTATRRDPSEREIRFRYDAEGRLTEARVGDAYRIAWDRDSMGRIVRLADSERAEARWERDGAGRVLAVESEGRSVRFTYDLAGRITEADGNGGAVRFAYDEQDRLRYGRGPGWMTFSYEDGRTEVKTSGRSWVYSPNGDLLEAREGETKRRFRHGTTGELRSVEEEEADEKTLRRMTYDDEGRPIRVEGDVAVTLGYDADGLLETVTGAQDTFPYSLEYDDRLRLARVCHGETVWDVTVDEAGCISSVGEHVALRYDELDRCIAVRVGESAEKPLTGEDVERFKVGEGVSVLATRRGVALVSELAGFSVPLYVKEDLRRRPLPLAARVARMLVLGSEAVLVSAWSRPGPPGDAWTLLASAEGFTTGLPGALALGVPWPILDFFLLFRYDPHTASRSAGALPSDQADPKRAPDASLTGSHRRGVLHPAVWPERAHSSCLVANPLASSAEPAARALRLYQILTA